MVKNIFDFTVLQAYKNIFSILFKNSTKNGQRYPADLLFVI